MTHNKRLEDRIWIRSSNKYDKLYKGILICESHFIYTELGVILITESGYPQPRTSVRDSYKPASLVFCILRGSEEDQETSGGESDGQTDFITS